MRFTPSVSTVRRVRALLFITLLGALLAALPGPVPLAAEESPLPLPPAPFQAVLPTQAAQFTGMPLSPAARWNAPHEQAGRLPLVSPARGRERAVTPGDPLLAPQETANLGVASSMAGLPIFNLPFTLPQSGNALDLAIADLDGDGALDLVLANSNQPSQIYRNDGQGRFGVPVALAGSGRASSSVAVGDLNGDGALDLVLGNDGQASQVYLNDGRGGFSSSIDLPAGAATQRVAIGDIDGDGAFDLVLVNFNQASQVYRNDAAGRFTLLGTLPGSGGQSLALALGDFDRNGALDVVLANGIGASQVFFNRGGGDFAAPLSLGSGSDAWAVAAGDLDRNGYLDLVLGRNKGDNVFGEKYDQIYLNDGQGGFSLSDEQVQDRNATRGIALGDVNGDGTLDLVTANNDAPGMVFLNNYGANLNIADGMLFPDQVATPLPGLGEGASNVALGDLNGDGALDIVQSVRTAGSRAYLSRGAVQYGLNGFNQEDTGDTTWTIAVGDLNGDGIDDLVLANSDLVSQTYMGDGAGNFALPIPLPGRPSAAFDAALGDLDGDGDRDIVAASPLDGGRVYLNDGRGRFAEPQLIPRTENDGTIDKVRLGDLNGDNALDIVSLHNIAVDPDQTQNFSRVYLNRNDGSGTFDPPRDIPGSLGLGRSIALGDLDGDGDLDLVLADTLLETLGGPGRIFFNNGRGNFADPVPLQGSGRATFSVVLADLNADTTLDIVLGNFGMPSQIYLNNGNGSFAAPRELPVARTWSIAPGDFDRDGDIDLILGNVDEVNLVYRNDGLGNFGSPIAIPFSDDNEVRAIATGDFDRDDDLDFIQGNIFNASRIYLNDGQANFTRRGPLQYLGTVTRGVALGDFDGNGLLDWVRAADFGPSIVTTYNFSLRNTALISTDRFADDVAVGDLDGNGSLDIALAKSCEPAYDPADTCVPRPSLLYLNDGSGNFAAPRELPAGVGNTRQYSALALGDLNGDNTLDLVLGRGDVPSLVYLNDGQANFAAPRELPAGGRVLLEVALGDLNDDGALDIVLGNFNQPSQVYLNDGSGNFGAPRELPDSGRATQGVAVGDLNADGALDIVLANGCIENPAAGTCDAVPSQVYINNSRGDFLAPVELPLSGLGANDVAIGDMDGDRDLDLVFTNLTREGQDQPANRVQLNDGSGNFTQTFVLPFGNVGTTFDVALGDIDLDGILDMVFSMGGYPGLRNQSLRLAPQPLANTPPTIAIFARPGPAPAPAAPLYSTPRLLDSTQIDVPLFVFDHENDPLRTLRAFYSSDGGGTWRPANTVTASGVVTNTLSNLPTNCGFGCVFSYQWDTFASGFFGQSDNVVFRFEATQGTQPRANGVPGPFQRAYAYAVSTPFRVRGTTVQVVDPQGRPIPNAEVYRVPAGQAATQNFPQPDQPPRVTTTRGFVPGSGTLGKGDQLLALVPITSTGTYTVYASSARPTPAGLGMHRVEQPGLQTLTVDPANTFIRFNLDVALEWDARNDPAFLNQLQNDLRRSAEVLFDLSDGQATLGQITIHHNRERWDEAHIRIYASNRLRPNAVKGGVVEQGTLRPDPADPNNENLAYASGQVRMGASWNRYGDPGGILGEDWPRTLAHELGHFLFYLDDNYLGLDAQGKLVTVDDCKGAMTNPYDDENSEFHPQDASWQQSCAATLSQRLTARADWSSITTFYPGLQAPAQYNANPGPSSLPLLPEVRITTPNAPNTTLNAPIYGLRAGNASYSPDPNARGYLLQAGRLIALGGPTSNGIEARGARPGDRLCVFDNKQRLAGCRTLDGLITPLTLEKQPENWQPELSVTPVNSTTLQLDLFQANLAEQTIEATLYPATSTAPVSTVLTPNGADRYSATLRTSPDAPVFEGFVHVRVVDAAGQTLREEVSDFLMGGNPGQKHARGAPRGNPGQKHARGAPVISPDGQAILFGPEVKLAEGEFFALQSVRGLPTPLPPWTVPVGTGYRLSSTPGAPLGDMSMLVSYLGSDLRPLFGAGEDKITLFLWNENQEQWEALPTRVDTVRNEASAVVRGPGLYALMIASPLQGAGWNTFRYTGARLPIADALASVAGTYRIIYYRDPTDSDDPWKIYAPGMPDWINDLKELIPGRDYYVYVPAVAQGAQEAQTAANGLSFNPPATFYGTVSEWNGFTPAPGQAVEALVGDLVCGRGSTLLVDGQLVYTLNVNAAGTGEQARCGTTDRAVRLRVAGQLFPNVAPWNDTRVTNLPLGEVRLFVPLIQR